MIVPHRFVPVFAGCNDTAMQPERSRAFTGVKRGKCHLELRDAKLAADYAEQALPALDPSFTRHVALTTVDLGRARVQSQEIDEAARLFGDAGEIAAHNSSTWLIERLKQGRADLRPWQHTPAVRELDDRLTSYGLVLV